jgi:hypothetical protein
VVVVALTTTTAHLSECLFGREAQLTGLGHQRDAPIESMAHRQVEDGVLDHRPVRPLRWVHTVGKPP